MIEQYEKAILEWFYWAYTSITEMVYAEDLDTVLSKKRIATYPCLIYSREPMDFTLSKAIPYKESNPETGKVAKTVMFSIPQEYQASLYLNNEKDLYRVANVIRQKWYQESYVTLRYPDKATQMRVGMRLLSFKMESVRDNVDVKGPQRVLRMRWRSDLILEAEYQKQAFTGYRVHLTKPETGNLSEMGDIITIKPILSTCKGDKCSLVDRKVKRSKRNK